MRQVENICYGHDQALKRCSQFAYIWFSVNNPMEISFGMQVLHMNPSIFVSVNQTHCFVMYVLYRLFAEVMV